MPNRGRIREAGSSVLFLALETGAALTAERWGFGVVAALAVIGVGILLWGWWPEIISLHSRQEFEMIPVIGMIVFGIGFIGSAAWYFWSSNSNATQGTTSTVTPNAPPPSTAMAPTAQATGFVTPPSFSEFDRTITTDCAWKQLPDVVPEDGLSWMMLAPQNGVGWAGTSLLPGSKMNWDGASYPSLNYFCTFKNYGPKPILTLKGQMTIEYFEVIKESDSTVRSGKLLLREDTPFLLGQIGINRSRGFYVMNLSALFVKITISQQAAVQPAGLDTSGKVSLAMPASDSFVIPPFTMKNMTQN